jgi:5-hydroxyisourate hydrolase-like protein (transthyretin family)
LWFTPSFWEDLLAFDSIFFYADVEAANFSLSFHSGDHQSKPGHNWRSTISDISWVRVKINKETQETVPHVVSPVVRSQS